MNHTSHGPEEQHPVPALFCILYNLKTGEGQGRESHRTTSDLMSQCSRFTTVLQAHRKEQRKSTVLDGSMQTLLRYKTAGDSDSPILQRPQSCFYGDMVKMIPVPVYVETNPWPFAFAGKLLPVPAYAVINRKMGSGSAPGVLGSHLCRDKLMAPCFRGGLYMHRLQVIPGTSTGERFCFTYFSSPNFLTR